MNYFKQHYDALRYPLAIDDTPGLRDAQAGAIHSIGAHFCRFTGSAIIVMPTGSGKTAVLMMSPFLLRSKRVMVVTPSRLVRSQIFEEFSKLNLLKKIGVLSEGVPAPSVMEMKSRIESLEMWEECRKADVVIGTPNGMSPAYSAIPAPPDDLFDLLLIDEAHHSPARTWKGTLEAFPNAKRILFTATPFRKDKKEIKGKVVFEYSIRRAYEDGIFGEIKYVPVVPGADKSSDLAICEVAERTLKQDRADGLNHSIMVRTDTKKRASELSEIYSANTSLQLRVIHSGHSYRHIKSSIKKLKQGDLDGIICVDMLGEGFDYPNLKIAAIHAPHKSLEVTLQFIGRFARTSSNDSGLGVAKFLAVPTEIEIESKKLYDEGAIWQELITNLSETSISREVSVREAIESFNPPSVVSTITEDISLYALHPYTHVKVYQTTEIVNIENEVTFPPNLSIVYQRISPDLNSAVYITVETQIPKWTDLEDFRGSEYDLFVIYADPESNLLFINASRKSDSLYEEIARQLSPEGHKILPLSKINRVLINLQNPAFFNIGMKNRVLNSSLESYRIITGTRAQDAIRRSDSQLYHRGHVFGKAEENDVRVTIGYSSASKVWANRYARIPELIDWCATLASKLNIDTFVSTSSRLDLLSVGQEITTIPSEVVCASLSELSFRQPLKVEYLDSSGHKRRVDLLDLEIEVVRDSTTEETAQLQVCCDDLRVPIEFSLSSAVYFRITDPDAPKIQLLKGHDSIELIDYLNANPLDLYLGDMSRISGSSLFPVQPGKIEPFDPENIVTVDWNENGVDIMNEFNTQGKEDGMSIHEFISGYLSEKEPELLIYDHRTGEIADHLTIHETEDSILIELYHSKKSGGATASTRLGDVYEVTSQVVKSTYWINRPQEFHDKVKSRIRSGSQYIIGDGDILASIFNRIEEKQTQYRIYVVQPGISKQSLNEVAQRVLAAASDYALRAGTDGLFVIASD